MTNDEMYEKSFERPRDYFHLSRDEQDLIDISLGIRAWVGTGLKEHQEERFAAHYD